MYLCQANYNRPRPFNRIYRDRALNSTWPTTLHQEEFKRFIKPKFLLSAKPRQVRSRCRTLRENTWFRHRAVWPASKCIRESIRIPRKDRYDSYKIPMRNVQHSLTLIKVTREWIKWKFDIKDPRDGERADYFMLLLGKKYLRVA